LFSEPPDLPFYPGIEICPDCQRNLKVYKTTTRKVFTLHIGCFFAKETLLYCGECKANNIYRAEELSRHIPANSNYGYDIIIYIGEAMFIKHLQAVEIQILLKKEYNIPVSISEIEYLSKKFIVYIAEIQEKYNFKIVDCMKNNGGYILHLDALGGTGGDRLISGLDSISDIVLNNSKIASENSIVIKPFLEKIKNDFGEPIAVVQDMGRGIMKAVEDVFDDPLILICHFHFLRDLGKDLLKGNNDILKKRIQYFNIRVELRNCAKEVGIIYADNNQIGGKYNYFLTSLYTILEWILDWKSSSDGYGFPFDRSYYDLIKRIKTAEKELNKLDVVPEDLAAIVEISTLYDKAIKLLETLSSDAELNNAMTVLNTDIEIFDNLRAAMRIAPKEKGKGLNDPGDDNIELIETKVIEFIKTTKENKEFCESKKGKIFFKQIEKYQDKLFSDPIKVTTADGELKLIQPQRTNNIMEQMFRKFTRDNKRKTGDDSIKRTIQGMVKDTPLIRNWQNDKYMEMMLDKDKSKVDLFAEIDFEKVSDKMKRLKEINNKIPKKIREILKSNKGNDTLKL
jgi:hypothetical protein